MYDLTTFTMSDKVACTSVIRNIGAEASGVEDVSERIVRFYYDQLGSDGEGRACALVRLYVTRPYADLDEERREFVRAVLGGEPSSQKLMCLTLMATVGDEESWSSPHASAGHKAIPLVSEQMVRESPMIAQLILQLGLDVGAVLTPDPTLLVNLDEKPYGVFYVPIAQSSPYIPAQKEFVERYKIKSVLGVGGLMPSGEFYALILFTKVHVPLETARLFKTFALSLKSALLNATLAEPR